MSGTAPGLDFDELHATMRRGVPPTNDDVPVMLDGARLDTPAKVREWVDETVRRHRAAMKAAAPESAH